MWSSPEDLSATDADGLPFITFLEDQLLDLHSRIKLAGLSWGVVTLEGTPPLPVLIKIGPARKDHH